MVHSVKFADRVINYSEFNDFPALKEEIYKLINDELGFWPGMSFPYPFLSIYKCAGGMSNVVLKVENGAGLAPTSVLVRLFGTGNSLCSPRQKLETFWMALLSECGNCPKVLLGFANGRIEAFLEGHFTLTLEDIRSDFYSMGIAKELAAIHQQTTQILNKTIEFLGGDSGTLFTADSILKDVPLLGKSFEDFFASKYAHFNPFVLGVLGEIDIYGSSFRRSLDFISHTLQEISQDAKSIVFIHGDLLNANIMASTEHPSKVTFIDYEYAGFGSRALDIANHFCEYMNCFATVKPYQQNYHLFPSDAKIAAFIKTYIEALDENRICFSLSEKKLEAMIDEILFFSCVVAIRWTMWALFQFRMRIETLSPEKFHVEISDIHSVESKFFYIVYAKYKLKHFEKLITNPLRPSPIAKIEQSLASGVARELIFPLTYLNF